MTGILADLDHLTAVVSPSVRASIGIGVDTAAVLLSVSGDNPERIRSERAFAALFTLEAGESGLGFSTRQRDEARATQLNNVVRHNSSDTTITMCRSDSCGLNPHTSAKQRDGITQLIQAMSSHYLKGFPMR